MSHSSKSTFGFKALGLLLLSVFLTQLLWSNVAFTELAQISKPTSPLAYMQLGATSFATLAFGHMMFVLALFLFGSKQQFVTKQLLAFSAAHILTLWLGTFNVIHVSNYVLQTLVPLTTILIAGENLYAKKLKSPRIAAVFGCGLIHGLAMAGNIHESQTNDTFTTKSLLMYNIGVELAILCLAIPASLILVKLASGKSYSKMFFNMVSAALILGALYYMGQHIFMPNS